MVLTMEEAPDPPKKIAVEDPTPEVVEYRTMHRSMSSVPVVPFRWIAPFAVVALRDWTCMFRSLTFLFVNVRPTPDAVIAWMYAFAVVKIPE
jgi:hypothetical protein